MCVCVCVCVCVCASLLLGVVHFVHSKCRLNRRQPDSNVWKELLAQAVILEYHASMATAVMVVLLLLPPPKCLQVRSDEAQV